MESAWPWQLGPSAGRRWKVAVRSWWTASAPAASGSAAATGRPTLALRALRSRRSERGRERPAPGVAMSAEPVRVACVGLGWWSDVLAAAIDRSRRLRIVACYSRSAAKREAFAARYRCSPAATYGDVLRNPDVEAIVNTTPNA